MATKTMTMVHWATRTTLCRWVNRSLIAAAYTGGFLGLFASTSMATDLTSESQSHQFPNCRDAMEKGERTYVSCVYKSCCQSAGGCCSRVGLDALKKCGVSPAEVNGYFQRGEHCESVSHKAASTSYREIKRAEVEAEQKRLREQEIERAARIARNQAEETRRHEESLQRQTQRDRELADIRAGKAAPTGCADLILANAIPFLDGALLDATQRIHYAGGTIEHYESGTMMLKARNPKTGTNHFVKGITSPHTKWFEKEKLSIGSNVAVVGRYTRNERVSLVSGASAPVVVIEVECVEDINKIILSSMSGQPSTSRGAEVEKSRQTEVRETDWKPARTVATNKTNVRAMEDITSLVVMELSPNQELLVQPTDKEWWGARSKDGSRFLGYVRKDRVTLDTPR